MSIRSLADFNGSSRAGTATGRHRHRRRPGLKLPADTTNEGWDFYLATSEDLNLATRGDFLMATDNSPGGRVTDGFAYGSECCDSSSLRPSPARYIPSSQHMSPVQHCRIEPYLNQGGAAVRPRRRLPRRRSALRARLRGRTGQPNTSRLISQAQSAREGAADCHLGQLSHVRTGQAWPRDRAHAVGRTHRCRCAQGAAATARRCRYL